MEMQENTKVNMNWDQVRKAVEEIIVQAPIPREFDRIVCIGRGGMVLSRILSGALGINRIEYQKASRNEEYYIDVIHDKTLFVDDILDTGTTFERFHSTALLRGHNMETISFAFLVARGKTLDKFRKVKSPLLVGEVVTFDNYIVFPWEAYDVE